MSDTGLPAGLHESLLTHGLRDALDAGLDIESVLRVVDPADAPHVLSRHIGELTRRALERELPPLHAEALEGGVN